MTLSTMILYLDEEVDWNVPEEVKPYWRPAALIQAADKPAQHIAHVNWRDYVRYNLISQQEMVALRHNDETLITMANQILSYTFGWVTTWHTWEGRDGSQLSDRVAYCTGTLQLGDATPFVRQKVVATLFSFWTEAQVVFKKSLQLT